MPRSGSLCVQADFMGRDVVFLGVQGVSWQFIFLFLKYSPKMQLEEIVVALEIFRLA